MRTRFTSLLLLAAPWLGAQTPLWEPATIVAVEQVSTPAKAPDPSCRAVPRGTTLPPRCRPANLRAQHFWRVTLDAGGKRYVVRPYRGPALLDALSQDGAVYINPEVTPGSAVEVAVSSAKTLRLSAGQGQGMLAMIDSQQLTPAPQAPYPQAAAPKIDAPRVSPPVSKPSSPSAPGKLSLTEKVVLLENSDFIDLEIQQFQSQEIGDGVALFSLTGASSPVRIGSNPPVFLVLTETDSAPSGTPELSRLQTAPGTRQMTFSLARRRSASSVPITITQVSPTVRRITVSQPLPPGEYAILPKPTTAETSRSAFLFEVR